MTSDARPDLLPTPPTMPPREATTFYDPLSYAAFDYPYDTYRRLRDEAPVYYNEARDLYVVSRYADVQAGLKNSAQLSNALGNDVDGTHDSYGGGNLVAQDAPRHTALRAAVRRVFSARELLSGEADIRQFARRLANDLRAAGGGDFTSEFALPLAIGAATQLVGAPSADNAMLQDHLIRSMQRTVGQLGLPDDAVASNQETEEHLDSIVERRASEIEGGADAAGNDAISQILAGVHSGKVDPHEKVGLAHLILSAAIDAPASLTTNCIAMLDKFPALQPYLREHREAIAGFVEETLRYDAPAQNLSRQTTAEITIADVTIPENSRVMLLLGSANRDERVYDDPDEFDIAREFTSQNRIMSFGEGMHACMGSPLARLTTRIAMEELLQGPDIHIVGTPERWVKQMVRGFASLPVQFVA
jgi:cytochrome P450